MTSAGLDGDLIGVNDVRRYQTTQTCQMLRTSVNF
jgi:hypothetical protein